MPEEIGGAPYDLDPVGVTLTGTGTTPIDTTPRSTGRWQFIAQPWNGGQALELTRAKSRRLTAKLGDNCDVAFSIDGRHTEGMAISNLVTDLHVLFTPDVESTAQRVVRGRVGGTQDAIGVDTHVKSVTVLDYKAILNARELFSWNTLDYSGLDQGEIVWEMIAQTQGNIGGDLGISKGWTGTSPTGVVKAEWLAQVGDFIGDRIKQLSETLTGFDWDIIPTSNSALSLEIYYPQRGLNRSVVLLLGGLVTEVNRNVDTSTYRNAIRQTGADGLDAVEVEAPDLASREEGRWDGLYGDTALLTQAQVNDRTAWQADDAQVLQPSYTVKLRDGSWKGPAHVWIGDYVRLVFDSGAEHVDDVLRVFEVSIDINDDGGETVQLTLGGPAPDPAGKAVRTDRRLKYLENH